VRGDPCIDCNRIAAGISKRVQELLPPAPEPEPEPAATVAAIVAPASLPEAPASVNCHIMLEGRQVQVTLRDTDETRLLERLTAVLRQYPLEAPRKAQDQRSPAGETQTRAGVPSITCR